jgi:hypothetical protein
MARRQLDTARLNGSAGDSFVLVLPLMFEAIGSLNLIRHSGTRVKRADPESRCILRLNL